MSSRNKVAPLLARVVALVVLLAACAVTAGMQALNSSAGRAQAVTSAPVHVTPSEPPIVSVNIDDEGLYPATLTIIPGTEVKWYSYGNLTHTVTITGVVSSGLLNYGDTFAHTFNTLGTFPYYNALHPTMQGVVQVVSANQVPVDLWVTAWHDKVLSPGATVNYHVQFANHDQNFNAYNAVLTVTLPANVTLVSSKWGDVAFPPTTTSGRVLVYALYDLYARDDHESNVIDLAVHLPDTIEVDSDVILTARLSASNPDTDSDYPYAEDIDRVAGADVAVFKRPAPESGLFVPGGTVTYALEYLNMGSYVDATSVVVTDRLPIGLTFEGALNDDGEHVTPITPQVNGNLLTFDLGTVAPGFGGQLLVQARLAPTLTAKTLLINVVGITTDAPQPLDDDNWSQDVQAVVANQPDLWVDIESSSDGQIDGYSPTGSTWAMLALWMLLTRACRCPSPKRWPNWICRLSLAHWSRARMTTWRRGTWARWQRIAMAKASAPAV